MSESIEYLRGMTDLRKEQRRLFGKPCPVCVEKLPRAHPSILVPQQVCRIHKYRDPRPESDMDSMYVQEAGE